MTELLFLLLPVAAGYGYVMGKNNAKSQAHKESREIISEYSKGLKFLLDREEDQGLEHLIELLEVSADSVEHYLALAAMFRRRGELDRAIKIHELLLKQASLDDTDKQAIIYELAQDYVMAGMLDSAEQQLLALIPYKNKKALTQLFLLYQQTNEWEKGIALYLDCRKLFSTYQLKAAIAHFYCEHAYQTGDYSELTSVINIDSKVIRPLFELGLQSFNEQDYLKAIHYWRDLLSHSPKHSPLFLAQLRECYIKLNLETQYVELLENYCNKYGVLIKIHYCEALIKQNKIDQAIEFLTVSLKREPNIRGFSFLISLFTKSNGDTKFVLNQINELVQSYISTKSEFQCKHCGFESQALYWFCPSCKHWESITPNHGLDGF